MFTLFEPVQEKHRDALESDVLKCIIQSNPYVNFCESTMPIKSEPCGCK